MPPLENQKIRSLLFYVYEDDEEDSKKGFEDSLISEVEDLIKRIAGSRTRAALLGGQLSKRHGSAELPIRA